MVDLKNLRSLEGKKALVTGSGRGLGRSHALVLAERGAHVIVHDIDGDEVAKTQEMVKKAGGKVSTIIWDIKDVGGFTEMVKREEAIDILVNNAGVGGGGRKIEDINVDVFNEMFEVHVRGSFFATQAVLPFMKAQKKGNIINISSIFAMGGHDSISHYAGAKSAISGFTKSWAKELAPWGINVNAVAPGFVITDMTKASQTKQEIDEREKNVPLGRFCQPIDISYAVAWLASSEAKMITGQVISPNSGEVIVGY